MATFKRFFFLIIATAICSSWQATIVAERNTSYIPAKVFSIARNKTIDMDPYFEYYYTTTSQENIQTIRKKLKGWRAIPRAGYSFKNLQAPIWLKLIIENDTANDIFFEIRFLYNIIDRISLFYDNETNPIHTGLKLPRSSRSASGVRQNFGIIAKSHKSQTLYFKINTRTAFSSAALFVPANESGQEMMNYHGAWLLYFGAILTLILYNLILYFRLKIPLYLYYCAFLIFFAMYQFFVIGYGYLFIYDSHTFNSFFVHNMAPLAIFFYLSFGLMLLDFKKRTPRLYRFLRFWRWGFAISLLLYLIYSGPMLKLFNNIHAIIALLGLLLGAVFNWKNNKQINSLFLVGWGCFIMGILLYVFMNLNLLPWQILYLNLVNLGNFSEMLFMAYALSIKIKIYTPQNLTKSGSLKRQGASSLFNSIFMPEKFKRASYKNFQTKDIPLIQTELDELVVNHKIYLEEDLRLQDIADMMGKSVHLLSEYFNQVLKSNFSSYIKELRIKHAAHLLTASPGLNILEIALNSGFASKSSFNHAFKAQTGITPREHRRQKILVPLA